MTDQPKLLLASQRCSECIATRNRIVDRKRARALIGACRTQDIHFQCHKGSIAGLNLHCRGVHEISPGAAYRFAKLYGIPIVEIDPDNISVPIDS